MDNHPDNQRAMASRWRRSRFGVWQQWVDAPTILIAVSWVALWMLWPTLPESDAGTASGRLGMVCAREGALPPLERYKRPDLIAFSSPLSFVPHARTRSPVPALTHAREARAHMLPRVETAEVRQISQPDAVALGAEAVRCVRPPNLPALKPGAGAGGVARVTPMVAVEVSAGLGANRPVWSSGDRTQLFSGSRPWEVELSLTLDEAGHPGRVFLEQESGDPEIDRAVVRILSRPDVWRHGTAGRGRVLVSFSPGLSNGGDYED